MMDDYSVFSVSFSFFHHTSASGIIYIICTFLQQKLFREVPSGEFPVEFTYTPTLFSSCRAPDDVVGSCWVRCRWGVKKYSVLCFIIYSILFIFVKLDGKPESKKEMWLSFAQSWMQIKAFWNYYFNAKNVYHCWPFSVGGGRNSPLPDERMTNAPFNEKRIMGEIPHCIQDLISWEFSFKTRDGKRRIPLQHSRQHLMRHWAQY